MSMGMGMGGYGQALGGILELTGGAIGGFSADDHRDEFWRLMNEVPKPDIGTEEGNWFADLERYFPRASRMSSRARQQEMTQNLALREQALPGFGAATGDAMRSIAPLLRGELPQGVMDAFTRAGGASTVGLGMGGSGFGALNTGLFGARGSLGAIQTGMGLLPALMGTLPQVSAPTTFGLLGQLMTPQQRIQHQMNLRSQQLGINSTYAGMPTMMDVWSQTLTNIGGQLAGADSGGGGGGGGLMGGSSSTAFASNPWGAATGANHTGAVNQAAGRLY